jgi:hypothetical protein
LDDELDEEDEAYSPSMSFSMSVIAALIGVVRSLVTSASEMILAAMVCPSGSFAFVVTEM